MYPRSLLSQAGICGKASKRLAASPRRSERIGARFYDFESARMLRRCLVQGIGDPTSRISIVEAKALSAFSQDCLQRGSLSLEYSRSPPTLCLSLEAHHPCTYALSVRIFFLELFEAHERTAGHLRWDTGI